MSFRVIKSPAGDKYLRKRIEQIKKEKLLSHQVIPLNEFRELKEKIDMHTVLVVDDDETIRNALKRILDSEGYQVFMAEDGLELSKILEYSRLDLILLDVNLPWVDGYELCRILKDHAQLKQIPIIFISARKSSEDIKLGIEAGADDYLPKPFDIDKLLNAIKKLLPPKAG